ncbi:MAG: ribosome-binding factor A [Candidatus Nomurabacteria bacterium]|jgi:ribosome-binding factor A
MSEFRTEKITNHIKELAAIFIEREAGPTSMITVTRVLLSPDNKRAKIMVSVLPREKEKAAYGFIRRNLGDLRKYVSKGLKINPVPFLEVEIDEGEKNRQRIDELLIQG